MARSHMCPDCPDFCSVITSGQHFPSFLLQATPNDNASLTTKRCADSVVAMRIDPS